MGTTRKRTRTSGTVIVRTKHVIQVLDMMADAVEALRAVVRAMGDDEAILLPRRTKAAPGRRGRNVKAETAGFWIKPIPILSPICKPKPFMDPGSLVSRNVK